MCCEAPRQLVATRRVFKLCSVNIFPDRDPAAATSLLRASAEMKSEVLSEGNRGRRFVVILWARRHTWRPSQL